MSNKKTKYQCFNCGNESCYNELNIRLTYTQTNKGKTIEHYNHSCSKCGWSKFLIFSIVEKL